MSKTPSTAATRLLKEKGVAYTEHPYRYEEHGGTRVSARELGVDEHAVVKTLVMPAYMEKSILDLPTAYLNGGSRGFLVGLDPREIVRVFAPGLVEVAIAGA